MFFHQRLPTYVPSENQLVWMFITYVTFMWFISRVNHEMFVQTTGMLECSLTYATCICCFRLPGHVNVSLHMLQEYAWFDTTMYQDTQFQVTISGKCFLVNITKIWFLTRKLTIVCWFRVLERRNSDWEYNISLQLVKLVQCQHVVQVWMNIVLYTSHYFGNSIVCTNICFLK